jgi:hypothetical protein
MVWAAIALAQVFVRVERTSVILEKAFIVAGVITVLAIALTW